MDLQTRKITFVRDFLTIQNEEVVTRLENYLKKQKIELFQDNFQPKTASILNLESDIALADIKNGKVINAHDLLDKVKKWG